MTLEDISETVRELAREEDPNQVARILDEFVDRDGRSVVSGYNDRAGYFLTPRSGQDDVIDFISDLLEKGSSTSLSDAPNSQPNALVRHLVGLLAREGKFDLGDYRQAEDEAYNIDIEDPETEDSGETRGRDDGK